MLNNCKTETLKMPLKKFSRAVSQLLHDQQLYVIRVYAKNHSQSTLFGIENPEGWHDLVLTELGQSWELDSSQILWQWTWQASHFTLVLGRCHNVSKKINSEKQRLLTIHWLVTENTQKCDYFLSSIHNQPRDKEICRNFQPLVS